MSKQQKIKIKTLVSEYINELKIVSEAKRSAKDIGVSIEASSDILQFAQVKKGAARIKPKIIGTKLTDEQITDILNSANIEIKTIIPPGKPGSTSSKFDTYVVYEKNNPSVTFNVVFTVGGNKGHKFEKDITDEFENARLGTPSSRVKKILQGMKILPEEIESIEQTGPLNSKRKLTQTIVNVGPIISDLTLTLSNGKKHFISLKNKGGKTIANYGYKNGFVLSNHSVKSGQHYLDEFVEALGIDKNVAAEGFSKLVSGDKSLTIPVVNKRQDFSAVENFLASAYGCGYWYVREAKEGFQILDLRTPHAVKDLVGNVTGIKLSYPGVFKQTAAIVSTTTNTYHISIRNTAGAIDPNTITIAIY